MYESKNSVYCYKGTNVLVNKMNIKDPIALKNYETSVIGLKLMALSKQGITGKFDVSHFVSIHKFLFEDIYPFAGLFRTENIAKDYFNNQKNQTVEIIKLNGSVELAPIVGLSEVIVDIVETGSTLRENGLEVLEEVCPLSARMVVNQVSLKMENERIRKLLADLNSLINKEA